MTHVAISAHRKAQFEALTGGTCALIPNGLHPGELDLSPSVNTLAEKSGFFAGGWALLHPARLLRRKNIELSLRVTAALREAGHPAFLLLTAPPDPHNPGSENYARELRTLRSELGLEDHAFFLHDHFPLDSKDLHSLYRIADALFFPSHQEGFGLPLLEAALHGKPVFCPGIEPMKTVGAGFAHFFPLEATPEQIAAQIAGVLQGSREIHARKSVLRDYAWAAIYEKFLAPLLLKKPSSHPE
jgi:glycosyltransferase involved in cell wall biosynthesis